ncbi:MAG: hypothetical protein ABIA04_01210 [Pseudomonadota bacterium]
MQERKKTLHFILNSIIPVAIMKKTILYYIILMMFISISVYSKPYFNIKAGGLYSISNEASDHSIISSIGISTGSKRNSEFLGLEINAGLDPGEVSAFRYMTINAAYTFIPWNLLVFKVGLGAAGARAVIDSQTFTTGPYLNAISTIGGLGLNFELLRHYLWLQVLGEYIAIWDLDLNRDFDLFLVSLQLSFF